MALHSFNNSLALGVLLNWTPLGVSALLAISWMVIAGLTGPLMRARPERALFGLR